MLQAERGDIGIVDKVARDARFFQYPRHHVGMIRRLGEQNQRGRIQNAAQIIERNRERDRRMVDAGMRDNSQKLVEAWPGNGSGKGAFRKFPKQSSGLFMPRAGTDFRVDEDVGVYRLHRSPAIHEVEELVAIQDVNAGLEPGFPPLQLQRVPLAPGLDC